MSCWVWGSIKREGDESAWDLHKSGYDFQKLKELVEQHKFRDINKDNARWSTRQTFGRKVL